jgi:hypothetical protein
MGACPLSCRVLLPRRRALVLLAVLAVGGSLGMWLAITDPPPD